MRDYKLVRRRGAFYEQRTIRPTRYLGRDPQTGRRRFKSRTRKVYTLACVQYGT